MVARADEYLKTIGRLTHVLFLRRDRASRALDYAPRIALLPIQTARRRPEAEPSRLRGNMPGWFFVVQSRGSRIVVRISTWLYDAYLQTLPYYYAAAIYLLRTGILRILCSPRVHLGSATMFCRKQSSPGDRLPALLDLNSCNTLIRWQARRVRSARWALRALSPR